MKIFENLLKNLGFVEDEELKTYRVNSLPVGDQTKFKNDNNSISKKNLIAIKPNKFRDIEMVVDALKNGECSILDLGQLKYKEMIRIIDFLSGAVYSLSGELKRLQGDLYLLTPSNIKINGENYDSESNNKKI